MIYYARFITHLVSIRGRLPKNWLSAEQKRAREDFNQKVKKQGEKRKMAVVSMKQLLEAGVHFGHQTRRWNPKMKKYIYSARNDIHIIDLQKTVQLAEEAYAFVRDIAASGKSILFVGTKKQAQAAIQQEAERCGQYFVNSRWLGGTLTNYKTIKSRIDRLNKLDLMEKMGD